MANQYINKVVKGEDTLIDLTADTATASDVAQGKYFHLATGERVQGTSSGGGGTEAGTVYQDAQGYLVLDDEAGSGSVSVEALSVTQNGTYTAPTGTAYSPVTVNVSGGGGGGNMSDPIRFFDYDGTLVASYSAVPASLPANPSHAGLVAQGWNWSLADIATQFAAMGTCNVGQMYTTDDGKTRIYLTATDMTKSFWFGLAPNGTLSIDWGDGSATSTLTGTSYTTIKTVQHEYATAGSYVIKVTVDSGGFAFYSNSSNYTRLIGKNESAGSYYNQPYGGCVTAIEIGEGARIGNNGFTKLFNMAHVTVPNTVTSIGTHAFNSCYALEFLTIPEDVTSIGTSVFYNCYALKSITIPEGVTSIGTSVFYNCYALKSITIPEGVGSIGSTVFYSCYALKSITIPEGVTSIDSSAFTYCYALESLTIPNTVTSIGNSAFNSCYALEFLAIPEGVTSIGNSVFYNCYTLKSITIPEGVTSIAASTFSACYNMEEYHFLTTTPPTLANTNAFSNIQANCKIYVPAASLSDYQTATNWATYSSYMVGE